MDKKCRLIVGVLGAIFLAASAGAQFGMRRPEFRGIWSPTVGAGAAYMADMKREGKVEVEVAVVGTETVDGKTGHWVEMVMKDREMGQAVVKHLIVLTGKETQIKKIVMQVQDQPPMEMPIEMMGMPEEKLKSADIREEAEHVGTETVTTPAGTFTCEHYRTKDKSADVWLAEKVSPYGLVKMTTKDTTFTLTRLISNAQTKIKGTPRKFDPREMMRQPPE